MALLSHLDVVRMLERSLRRSGLPVSFTGGFHPLPRLQLALALPLGVEAHGEWMDLEFLKAAIDAMGRSLKPSQIQHWLQEQLNQDLQMERVQRLALLLQ